MFKQNLKILGVVALILLLTATFFYLTQGTVNALKP